MRKWKNDGGLRFFFMEGLEGLQIFCGAMDFPELRKYIAGFLLHMNDMKNNARRALRESVLRN